MKFSSFRSWAKSWLSQRFAPPSTVEERNIRLLYWDIAWQGIVAAGTITFLPVYLARLNASSMMIGWLTAAPALVNIIVSLPASAWLERQHNHVWLTTYFRIFIRVTYLILAFLPFFLNDQVLPLVIVILWGLQAIPTAFAVPAWTSVMGAIVPPHRRPAVNGGRWALLSVVTGVSVALFGKFLGAEWPPFPLNYQIVFFISAITVLWGLVYFNRIIMPVDYAPRTPTHRPFREQFADIIAPIVHNQSFVRYLLSTFLIRMGIGMPVALYSIFWVRNLQASDTIIGLRTTVSQVALVAGYYLLGRFATRRGHRPILLTSGIGLGIYPIFTALSPDQYWLLPAGIIVGWFSAGINISFFEGLLETTPPERVPSFAAVNAIFANLATFIGPLLGSIVMEWLGIQVAFWIAGGLHFIGVLLCWRLGVGCAKGLNGRPCFGGETIG